jgi:hypothetical protein
MRTDCAPPNGRCRRNLRPPPRRRLKMHAKLPSDHLCDRGTHNIFHHENRRRHADQKSTKHQQIHRPPLPHPRAPTQPGWKPEQSLHPTTTTTAPRSTGVMSPPPLQSHTKGQHSQEGTAASTGGEPSSSAEVHTRIHILRVGAKLYANNVVIRDKKNYGVVRTNRRRCCPGSGRPC